MWIEDSPSCRPPIMFIGVNNYILYHNLGFNVYFYTSLKSISMAMNDTQVPGEGTCTGAGMLGRSRRARALANRASP